MINPRSRVRTVVGTGVLVLVLAACGGRQGVGGAAVTSPTMPSSASATTAQQPPGMTSPPATPPGGATVAESQVDSTALPVGYPHTVWTEQAGLVVGVYGKEGGCLTARAELGAQSADAVRIDLVNTDESAGRMCAHYIAFTPLRVQLAAPLGGRKVVLGYRVEKK